ncbi:hypothetical protein F5X96DRAFT_643369 [Biscogniauxia mediterranea]|nr:hypothetical protein F5X96DRAFT_643369 [Biscogniauxia mediterranea]
MSSVPPSYDADAPPPYHEVVDKLNKLIGGTDSPTEIIKAASKLDDKELLLLATYADKDPLKTDEQKKKFEVGVKTTIASEQEVPEAELKQGAIKAAQAVANIDKLFIELRARLTQIDDKYSPPDGGFAPKLEAPRQQYLKLLQSSRDLATEIAQHGQSFDHEVIRFCADKTLSVETRKQKIEKWIADAESFGDRSSKQNQEFDKLMSEIREIFMHYSTWAEPRFQEIEGQIKTITEQIEALDKEIDDLKNALAIAGAGAVAGFLGGAILTLCLGPVALIGGLVVAGASLLAGLGIIIAYAIKQSQRDDLTDKKRKLQDEEKNLQAIRDQLRDMANGKDSHIKSFQTNVNVLMGYWTHARSDAIQIQKWLHDAEDDADLPDYMKANLEMGVKYYEKMASYLLEYASGISPSSE